MYLGVSLLELLHYPAPLGWQTEREPWLPSFGWLSPAGGRLTTPFLASDSWRKEGVSSAEGGFKRKGWGLRGMAAPWGYRKENGVTQNAVASPGQADPSPCRLDCQAVTSRPRGKGSFRGHQGHQSHSRAIGLWLAHGVLFLRNNPFGYKRSKSPLKKNTVGLVTFAFRPLNLVKRAPTSHRGGEALTPELEPTLSTAGQLFTGEAWAASYSLLRRPGIPAPPSDPGLSGGPWPYRNQQEQI